MQKLIFVAAFIAVALGQTQLQVNSKISAETLVTENYKRYYIDVNESISALNFSITASPFGVGSSCDDIYIYVSPLGYPCPTEGDIDYPSDSDPCHTDYNNYFSSSSAGSNSIYNFAAGDYQYINALGYQILPLGATGRLYFLVSKYYEDDSCSFDVNITVTTCPGNNGINNGIAVATTYNSVIREKSYPITYQCSTYTNFTYNVNQNSTTYQINATTAGQFQVFKVPVAPQTAYVNVSFTGNFGASSSDDTLYVYLSAIAPLGDDSSYSDCQGYISEGSSTNTTTFMCTYTPAGYSYLIIDFTDFTTVSFVGTVTLTPLVCPTGTSTSTQNPYQCSTSAFVVPTNLFSNLPLTISSLAADSSVSTSFQIPTTLVGASLNITASSVSSGYCYVYIGRFMQAGYGTSSSDYSHYGTLSSGESYSLSSYFDLANGTTFLGDYYYLNFVNDNDAGGSTCSFTVTPSAVAAVTPPSGSTPSGSTTGSAGTTPSTPGSTTFNYNALVTVSYLNGNCSGDIFTVTAVFYPSLITCPSNGVVASIGTSVNSSQCSSSTTSSSSLYCVNITAAAFQSQFQGYTQTQYASSDCTGNVSSIVYYYPTCRTTSSITTTSVSTQYFCPNTTSPGIYNYLNADCSGTPQSVTAASTSCSELTSSSSYQFGCTGVSTTPGSTTAGSTAGSTGANASSSAILIPSIAVMIASFAMLF